MSKNQQLRAGMAFVSENFEMALIFGTLPHGRVSFFQGSLFVVVLKGHQTNKHSYFGGLRYFETIIGDLFNTKHGPGKCGINPI